MSNAADTTPHDEPIPTRLYSLLFVVGTLRDYGHHLADTVVARAKHANFATIAVYFGTGDLSLILARVQRGLLRAIALANLLGEYLAKGRDVAWVSPRRPPREPRAKAPARPAAKPATPSRWDDLVYPLTLEEIEVQVRRRPIGRTIVDICLDLAVMPGLCDRVFGSELFDAINGHRGSLQKWLSEKRRRWIAFDEERNRKPINGWWEWWDDTRERIRGVLGFLIGEPPALPAHLLPAPT